MRDNIQIPHDEIPVRDYIHIPYSKIAVLEGNPKSEGATLAADCLKGLKELENPKRFPPRLLILLTSPEYLEMKQAEEMLAGIHETFAQQYPDGKEVPLIGSSVSAVFCDREIHKQGALLICLASGLIDVQVGVGENARQSPRSAIKNLLMGLELNPKRKADQPPLANRLLLSFLPGFKGKPEEEYYPAPELHRLLREGVQTRMRLVGGVCSAGDYRLANDGMLYAGRRAFKDAVVAANVESGTPIEVNLNYGFEPTDNVVQVKEVDEDQRSILAFDKCSPAELIEQEGEGIVLLKFSTDGEPSVDLPRLTRDREKIRLLHKVKPNDSFRVGNPDEKKILQQFKESFDPSLKGMLVDKPIACLTLAGRTWNNCFQSIFDFHKVLELVEQEGLPCIGGFFDGEMGVDQTGRSLFFNGASSNLIFGDEMREPTPPSQGVAALAKFGPRLNDVSVEGFIKNALKIVFKTGFPGAMISLIQPNQGDDYIIPQGAIGKRFEKIMRNMTRRPLNSGNILAMVAKDNHPRFIPDSRKNPYYDDGMAVGNIISQYVLPLRRRDGEVLGILQVDLGELRHQTKDEFKYTEKAKTIETLAEIFGAGLSRISDNKEHDIINKLDTAFSRSLSAATVEEGLQQFINEAGWAFDVDMAHIRLVTPKDAGADNSKEQTLTLAAGFGPLYDAGRKTRRVISRKNASLIYEAFLNDPIIINDLTDSSDYQAVCHETSGITELAAAYKQVKSYAAIALKNEEGKKLGALSLASIKPWFFNAHHQRTIESLAQRAAFLIEHLRDRNRLQFLLKVSNKLAEIELDKIPTELEKALGRFCRAIKAELSSLYLWDESKEKFVLRAQYGWEESGWINAASYSKGDTWIGNQAFQTKPKYFPNIYKHYREAYNPKPKRPGGRYSKHMFGGFFSESFTFEAIGLPLKVGKKGKRFGILTLYRRIDPGEGSGFLSTDETLLEEGAYKMSGLVKALLEHRDDEWKNEKQACFQKVYEAITPNEIREGFAADVCQEIIKIYEAVEVNFYKVDETERAAISWVAGYSQDADAKQPEELSKVEPDELVIKAVSNALNEKKKEKEKIVLQRHKIRPADHENPKLLATDGLVERVCIPMRSTQQLVGVLDLKWEVTHQNAGLLKAQPEFLDMGRLGHILGAAYMRHQLASEAEQSKLAVQVTGAYVFQKVHRLTNEIQRISDLIEEIETSKNNEWRDREIKKLRERIIKIIEMINWIIDLGERVRNPARERIPVYELIRKSFAEIESLNYDVRESVHIFVAHDLVVMGAPDLLKEIFVNLIHNALRAMEARKQPVLNISAALCSDKKKIEIIFEDNGVGMTRAEIKDAERGFASKGSRKGVGVLISKVLAQVQGGSLRYESEKGRGTKAIVTLTVG